MTSDLNDFDASGLERSCAATAPGDWMRHLGAASGIDLLEAWFQGEGYQSHRHDTYAIGVTERGVQAFTYRGETHISLPGDVVVLHPDELHDGYAGAESGFGYRLVYVEPALMQEVVHGLAGNRAPLPFARQPVIRSQMLAGAVRAAFDDTSDALVMDEVVVHLAEGLLEIVAPSSQHPQRHLDLRGVERARQVLDATRDRVVRSWELEAASGLSRYELARQFRALAGTSPYRYSLLRRLDAARGLLVTDRALADIALATGFADQAHFTRKFMSAYGLSPARYRKLAIEGKSLRSGGDGLTALGGKGE
jgi:AraC-like DNA-binding protein